MTWQREDERDLSADRIPQQPLHVQQPLAALFLPVEDMSPRKRFKRWMTNWLAVLLGRVERSDVIGID